LERHLNEVKELRFRPTIETHDFDVKMAAAKRFLADGDRVRVVILFRGREVVHPHIGERLVERVLANMEPGCLMSPIKLEGKRMSVTINPGRQK